MRPFGLADAELAAFKEVLSFIFLLLLIASLIIGTITGAIFFTRIHPRCDWDEEVLMYVYQLRDGGEELKPGDVGDYNAMPRCIRYEYVQGYHLGDPRP